MLASSFIHGWLIQRNQTRARHLMFQMIRATTGCFRGGEESLGIPKNLSVSKALARLAGKSRQPNGLFRAGGCWGPRSSRPNDTNQSRGHRKNRQRRTTLGGIIAVLPAHARNNGKRRQLKPANENMQQRIKHS